MYTTESVLALVLQSEYSPGANPIKFLHLRTNLQTHPKACKQSNGQTFVGHNVRKLPLRPNIFIGLHFFLFIESAI